MNSKRRKTRNDTQAVVWHEFTNSDLWNPRIRSNTTKKSGKPRGDKQARETRKKNKHPKRKLAGTVTHHWSTDSDPREIPPRLSGHNRTHVRESNARQNTHTHNRRNGQKPNCTSVKKTRATQRPSNMKTGAQHVTHTKTQIPHESSPLDLFSERVRTLVHINNTHTFCPPMWADNTYWLYSATTKKKKLTRMVEEHWLKNCLDMEPKMGSLWWRRTHKEEGLATLTVGKRVKNLGLALHGGIRCPGPSLSPGWEKVLMGTETTLRKGRETWQQHASTRHTGTQKCFLPSSCSRRTSYENSEGG